MKEWKEYRLEEICTKITDGSHFSPQACQTGYPMFSVKDMLEYGFDYSNCKYISEKDFESMKSGDCVPQKGDILVAKDGSFLKQIFECKETKEEAILSSIAIFRPNQNIITPTFLCYLLKSPKVYNYIALNCVSGSALPRIVLKDFKKVTMQVPPLPTQQKIAAILSSLDDKIELNNKINTNLEQQAQALFKNWFLDFEPFGGKMPEGWKEVKIGTLPIYVSDYVANGSFADLKQNVQLYQEENYAYFIRNTDLKNNSFNTYVDEHSYNFLEKSRLTGGELIISNVGDVGSVYICPTLAKPMTLGNNIIMLRCNNEIYRYYLYMWFKWFDGKNSIKGITGGSVLQKFNKTDFKNMLITEPSTEVLCNFSQLITPFFDDVSQNFEENKKLTNIRDTLLPKLMNGEIEVRRIEY